VSRTGTYPNVIRQDVGRDGSLLAFRYARAVELVGRGEMGEFNTQFRWREVVDSPERYEVTLHGDTVTDVAIRRTRKFKLARGKHYAWSNVIPGAKGETQTGEAIASEDGLLVLTGVRTVAAGSRLTVTPK